MVVDADGKVQQRRVETHGMTRTDWILTGDLTDGDQVIVAGLQKVKPNALAKVAPMTGPAAGPSTAQTPGAPAAAPKG